MVKATFFDVHGTLLLSDDIEAAWGRWLNAYYNSMVGYGITASPEEFRHRVQKTASWNPSFKEQGYSTFMLQIRTLTQKYNIELTKEEINSLADRLISIWYEDMYLDPDATSVLRTLRENQKLGIISNWNHPPSLYVTLRKYGLAKYFDITIISDEVGFRKPDPRIFYKASETLSIQPSEAVYVGDDPVDVEGSLAAGFHPVVIRRGGAGYWDMSLEKKFNDELLGKAVVVKSLKELLGLF